MTVIDYSILKKKLFDYLNAAIEFDDTVLVSTKNGNAVILSETEYNSILETLYIVSQKGLVEKIKEGEKEDPSKMTTYNQDKETMI